MRFDETNGSQREHLPSVLDEPAPEDSIKFKATEDVIPTEEFAEEFIPVREEHRADAPEDNAEDNGAEENDQIPRRQPAHPRIAKEVQVDKIIDDIEAPGPLTRSKASHLSNFCGNFAFFSITDPTKVDEAFLELEWIQAMQEELEPAPEDSIKFKATEDVIPTEEFAEEFIPVREEHRADAPEDNAEDNGAEENDQIPRRQPAHPRIAKEVQVDKIIDDIEAPGPLTRSKASHLSNFCGNFAFFSITDPTKVDEAFLELEWIQAMQEELHQFELNNVCELVNRPDPRKHNIIGTK